MGSRKGPGLDGETRQDSLLVDLFGVVVPFLVLLPSWALVRGGTRNLWGTEDKRYSKRGSTLLVNL